MTNPNETHDQAALERQLNNLRTELQGHLKAARARRQTMVLVLILMVVVMVAYLSFIYKKVSEIDSQYVAEVAFTYARPYARQSPEKLSALLKEKAPVAFDYAEQRLMDAPAIGRVYVRQMLLDKTKEILDEAEPQIDKAVDDAVGRVKSDFDAAAIDGKDPAQVDKFIDKVVDQMLKDSRTTIDKVHADYSQQADDIVNYMERLADAKDLDGREERYRQILISFLSLSKKWETNPPPLGLEIAGEPAAPDGNVAAAEPGMDEAAPGKSAIKGKSRRVPKPTTKGQ